jgi:hypothetical protein
MMFVFFPNKGLDIYSSTENTNFYLVNSSRPNLYRKSLKSKGSATNRVLVCPLCTIDMKNNIASIDSLLICMEIID